MCPSETTSRPRLKREGPVAKRWEGLGISEGAHRPKPRRKKQCARLLDFYNFDDDKMETFQLFAPGITDKENHKVIQKQFSFLTNRDKVEKVLGI